MSQMLDVVIKTVSEIVDVKKIKLQGDTMIEDLMLDSLDEVEMMMTLEAELDVEINQADLSGCKTLGDLSIRITELVGQKS